jgi:hypothetical protein
MLDEPDEPAEPDEPVEPVEDDKDDGDGDGVSVADDVAAFVGGGCGDCAGGVENAGDGRAGCADAAAAGTAGIARGVNVGVTLGVTVGLTVGVGVDRGAGVADDGVGSGTPAGSALSAVEGARAFGLSASIVSRSGSGSGTLFDALDTDGGG